MIFEKRLSYAVFLKIKKAAEVPSLLFFKITIKENLRFCCKGTRLLLR